MPPERHSTPPPRPPRDRHTGPGFGGGPRRSFGGGGGFGGPRPPFAGPPPQPAPGLHTVRLREGDRELEATGTPDFVRQILDELPSLLARLRGEATPPSRPASIAMPPPPARAADGDEPARDAAPARAAAPARDAAPAAGHRRNRHAANGSGSLESRIFTVLEHADHPLSVAAIRRELGDQSTGQQIRRILERAADRVVASTERPAAYSLR